MRTNKVEEKDEHGNEVVRGIKRAESLFGLVPSLELLVERLNEVVGDIVPEGLYSNVPKPKGLGRLLVGGVAVGDESGGLAGQYRCLMQQGKGLG